LGLTITRAYVKLLGDQIALQSTPEEGARFSFALTLPPSAEEADEDAHDWARVQHLAAGEKAYALVVDDVLTNRDILAHMLDAIGVETQTAQSGPEALTSVRLRRPDIIFLDIRMPGMNGDEVLQRLLAEYGEQAPRIISVTASVLDHERKGYLSQGFNDFIDKPLHATQLYACLAEQLGVEFVYDEAASEEVGDWHNAQLSPALYAELEDAVNMHSITRLTELLDPIAADAPALGAHLRGLAEGYDIQGVKAVLADIEKQ